MLVASATAAERETRLSTASAPDDADALARGDLERDVVQDLRAVLECCQAWEGIGRVSGRTGEYRAERFSTTRWPLAGQ